MNQETEEIYREVQHLYGVPYVSAIHKSLATQPGLLAWAWHEVAPAFRTGEAQEAAWAAAAEVGAPALDPIPWQAVHAWGMTRHDVTSVRAAAETFLRVSPVNMMFAALIKLRLAGVMQKGAANSGASTPWQPPSAPATAPPPMIDVERADATTRDLAMLFATNRDNEPFVPGLYCMLLNWPGLAGHLGTVLPPRMRGAVAVSDALRSRIDDAAATLLRPAPEPPRAAPSPSARAYFARISATYRKTSPELVIAGKLIRDALPSDELTRGSEQRPGPLGS